MSEEKAKETEDQTEFITRRKFKNIDDLIGSHINVFEDRTIQVITGKKFTSEQELLRAVVNGDMDRNDLEEIAREIFKKFVGEDDNLDLEAEKLSMIIVFLLRPLWDS